MRNFRLLHSRRVATLHGWLVVAMAVFCGCSREPESLYVASQAVQDLSSSHQQFIQQVLTSYCGTPANPRMKVPTAEVDQEGRAILTDHFEPARLKHGAAVYARRCAGCHGVTGDGNGEAAPYLNPKPRDYRRGIFKFTSTPYGAKPRRQDIVRTIRRGAKGTSMPSFRWLTNEDMQALTDYVILLSYRGELEYRLAYEAEDYDAEEVIDAEIPAETAGRIIESWDRAQTQLVMPATAMPAYSEETIRSGQQAFQSNECFKCHGKDGRGQTEWLSQAFIETQQSLPEAERVKINYDAWKHVAPAADLTAGMLHGGRRPIDVYRRIYSGINGTPMPGFAHQFSGEKQTIWHLVHFVLSLTEGREIAPLDSMRTAASSATPSSGNGYGK